MIVDALRFESVHSLYVNFDVDCLGLGLSCSFSDTFSSHGGSILSWFWDFGDGATNTEQNPSHTYIGDGTHTVTLAVTDSDGEIGSESKTMTVDGTGYEDEPNLSVGGRVTLNGDSLPGVNIEASIGATCDVSNVMETGASQYSCTVPQGWSGTLTPVAAGFSFTPRVAAIRTSAAIGLSRTTPPRRPSTTSGSTTAYRQEPYSIAMEATFGSGSALIPSLVVPSLRVAEVPLRAAKLFS